MSVRVDREPCPARIVDDAGGAFVFGLIGGSVWHFFGGVRNAPSGQRMKQAVFRVRSRVPITGGSFAVWGVLFSCCDCTFTYLRKKEDPWNAIISGAATGGILAARAGIKAASRSAVVGGVILAAIEGLNIFIVRVLAPKFEQQQMEGGMEIDRLLPPRDPMRPRATIQKPKFKEEPLPLFQGSGGFSDTFSGSSPSQWDTPGFRKEENYFSSERTLENEDNSNKKSWWKFW